MPEWGTCKLGSSALTAGLLRAIDVDNSFFVGEHVVANLWDMTRFFDLVVWGILGAEAIEVGFPVYHLQPRRRCTSLATRSFQSPSAPTNQ